MGEDGPVSNDDRSPVEAALDVFVYAPIGLIFDGPALFPKLVERGRNQVTVARTIGEFAVKQGQVEATKAAARLTEQAGGVLDSFTATPGTPADAPASPPQPTRAAPPPPPTPSAPASAAPDASGLAIPDYDSLSASQVVNRLAGLSSSELDAVRAYESAGRGRKTVLNKVAQLQRS